jgi:hypothetical protein
MISIINIGDIKVFVKSVRKVPFNGTVYNFHCLPNENYFSNSVLVHNCYKGNTPKGENMTFETFKQVFHNLPRTLTQIAFGADASATANPDLPKMMEYCRTNSYNRVVPNITVADISSETADWLSKLAGAVAVSRYANKDLCFDSVKLLTDRAMNRKIWVNPTEDKVPVFMHGVRGFVVSLIPVKDWEEITAGEFASRENLDAGELRGLTRHVFAVNIHQMLSQETFEQAMETIRDAKTDPRLANMNAIVFLSLKPKKRGEKFHKLTDDQFRQLVDAAFALGVEFGFDSCSANKFTRVIKGHENYESLVMMSEPCESSCHSLYVNHKGQYFPCSFSECMDYGEAGDWSSGIDLTKPIEFIPNLWNNNKTNQFRKALLGNRDENGLRSCPLYEI